jgi:PAS domain S-box-containing protein
MPVMGKGDGMDVTSHVDDHLIQLFIVTAAIIGAVLTTIFSLSHGIFEVFPFLYILPIILVVYFYPRHGVIFSLGISIIYIGLVYCYGLSNPMLIAISTAWFAIFIMVGVVMSSFATRLHDERKKIKRVLENAQDGIFCFELRSMRLLEVNPRCARMLHYEREDLLGKAITMIWTSEAERTDFLSSIKKGQSPFLKEVALRTKDGTARQYLISAMLTSGNLVFCSAIDLTHQKVADDEIWQTLEELERQVVERTAHLEKINEQLKAEILERRRIESTLLQQEHRGNERRQPQ